MKLGTKGYDPLAAARAAEIDEVIERLAEFGGPRPTRVGLMFESCLLAYAALRSRRGEKCTVLLGQEAYDRAKQTGLLAWCREQYPDLTFEPPGTAVRGPSPKHVIFDEAPGFGCER